jgi:hypothetical protein
MAGHSMRESFGMVGIWLLSVCFRPFNDLVGELMKRQNPLLNPAALSADSVRHDLIFLEK